MFARCHSRMEGPPMTRVQLGMTLAMPGATLPMEFWHQLVTNMPTVICPLVVTLLSSNFVNSSLGLFRIQSINDSDISNFSRNTNFQERIQDIFHIRHPICLHCNYQWMAEYFRNKGPSYKASCPLLYAIINGKSTTHFRHF